MAGSFALTMRRETIVISSVKDSAIALAAAETGITVAKTMLFLADEEKRWVADGRIYQFLYEDTEIRIRVLSEQGKIDINEAGEELLETMLSVTELDTETKQSLVHAIIDWRDEDNLEQLHGAEKSQYEQQGLSYHPANKKFQLLDELQMVLGMTPAIYEKLQGLITVYSGQATVDRNLASKEVLAVIADPDVEIESIDEFIKQRVENDVPETDSDLPLQDIVEQVQSADNINKVYTIISQARLYARIETGIKLTLRKNIDSGQDNSLQLLDYRQPYQSVSLFDDELEKFLVVEEDESE